MMTIVYIVGSLWDASTREVRLIASIEGPIDSFCDVDELFKRCDVRDGSKYIPDFEGVIFADGTMEGLISESQESMLEYLREIIQ